MALTRVAPAGIGSTPGTGYVIGDSFLHSRGLNAIDANYTGIVTAQSIRVIGDLQVDGTTTTLDTAITEVDKLEVGANNNTVGVAITQSGTGDIFNLYDGGTEVFSVRDGGNVGIKNATGLSEFPVDVGGEIASKNANKEFIGINLTNNEARIRSSFYSGASGAYRPITFYTSDAERLRITSTGLIGISESTPDSKVDILHSTSANPNTENLIHLRTDPGAGYVSRGLFIKIGRDANYDNSAAHYDIVGSSGNSGFHAFEVQGDEKLRITKDGKIGIGTATPGHKLEVAYTSDDDGFVVNHANRGGKWRFSTSGSNAELFDIRRYDGANSTFRRYLLFGPNQFSVYTGSTTSATERFRITSSGNVGIKTASPLGDFSVLTDNNGYFTVAGSGGNGAELRFHKKSDKSLTYSIQNNGGGNELVQHVLAHSSGRYSWSIGGTERLRITSAGELNLTNGTINLGTADSSSGHINAYELMTFNIDSDNDDSNRHFTWYKNGESGGGTGMMRLDENGRLVIGGDLATSGNNLTLKHATGVEIDMHATSGSGNNFRIKSDSSGVFTIRDHSAGSDRITILDNGNVGINETNPIGDLSLTGANGTSMELQPDLTNGTNRITNYNRSTSTYKGFRLDASYLDFYISGAHRFSMGSTGQMEVSNTVSSNDAAVNIYKATGSNTDKAILRVGYDAAAAFEIYRIRNNGDIFAGPNQSGSDFIFQSVPTGGSTTERLKIQDDGKVLIYGSLGAGNLPLGGNASSAALHVRGTTKYHGIAFGQNASNATIGVDNTKLVYTANANPANLGGGKQAAHEWWSGSSGGGGPNKLAEMTTDGALYLGAYPTNHTNAAYAPFKLRSGSDAWAMSIGMRSSQNDYAYIGFTDMNGTEHIGDIFMQRTGTSTGHMVFSTNNGSGGSENRLRIGNSGRVCISPDASFAGESTNIAMSIVSSGGDVGGYPGINLRSTDSGGGTNSKNGMSIVSTDGNWSLYSNAGNVHGLGILAGNSADSGNCGLYVRSDKKITMGPETNNEAHSTNTCGQAVHIAGGGLGIGALSNYSAQSGTGGRYVLGWYHANAYTGRSGNSYLHLTTSLWGGGSPHGNSEYIMGGFKIKSYRYSPAGVAEEIIMFHNWSGAVPGYARQHTGTWDPGNAVYVRGTGFVTIRLNSQNYVGYIIDLIQYNWYPARDIRVTSANFSNSSTL